MNAPMKLIVWISAMLLQVLGAAAHAVAESPRIALVIGNGAYSLGAYGVRFEDFGSQVCMFAPCRWRMVTRGIRSDGMRLASSQHGVYPSWA